MTNGYLTFLDYLELRRRVEKRLTSGNRLFLHIVLFGLGATIAGVAGFNAIYTPGEYFFIDAHIGYWVSAWSALLLAHGLWTYVRSGASSGRRDHIIESEMRERLQAHDMYLSDHPKDLFRLHGILNDDIKSRSHLPMILLFYIFLNALLWLPWAITDARTSFAWQISPMLIVPLVLTLATNIWVRARHERQLRKQLEQLFGYQQSDDDEPDYAREARLNSDDEMVTIEDYMLKRKRG